MNKIFHYIFAIGISIGVVFIKFKYPQLFGENVPFLLFFIAVAVTTRISGFSPGLLSLICSAFLAWYFFLTSNDSMQLSPAKMVQLSVFLLESFTILLLVTRLRKSTNDEHIMRKKFETILTSIGDSVIGADKQGLITYMNPMAEQITGWKFKDAKDKKIQEVVNIIHDRTRENLEDPVETIINAGKVITLADHMMLITKDGREVHIEDSAAPVRNEKGDIVGIVIVFRDVSQRKQLEEHRELLLGVASHELKNNIAGMHGYTQLLQRTFEKDRHPKAEQYADKLNRKVEILTSIITGMLDVTRLKAGTLEMKAEQFNITDLIQEVTADSEVILKRHNLIINGEQGELVRGDKIRLSQVITNLISNAAKYSPPDTDIVISLDSDQEKVTVGVQDFGMGIPVDRQENIFKPFYRAVEEVDKANISGSGLGLYISYEIVKQNGGNMWVESREGEGSTFYFTIPLANPVIEEKVEVIPQQTFLDKIRRFFPRFNFR